MILTVCLNPCTDVTIEVDSLNIGKLNHVKNKTLSFTGKALNVAIGVARLKGDSYATGFMYNENGSLFEQALDREGVPSAFVWNRGRVRENYKFIDNKSMLTEVNDIGEPISANKQEELLALVASLSKKSDVMVVSSSLPHASAAVFSISSSTCAYMLSVTVVLLCPNRLLTTLIFTPALSNRVACVWRIQCIVNLESRRPSGL